MGGIFPLFDRGDFTLLFFFEQCYVHKIGYRNFRKMSCMILLLSLIGEISMNAALSYNQ